MKFFEGVVGGGTHFLFFGGGFGRGPFFVFLRGVGLARGILQGSTDG
jgi:hypothetical protein